MKIRPSIRLYFLAAMLITGIGSIGVMTVTAVNYFFSGMDVAMSNIMRSQAIDIPLGKNDTPVQLDELHIAANWQDLPQFIQDNINQDDLVVNQLTKKIDGIPVLSPPKFGYFAMKVKVEDKSRYVAYSFSHLDDKVKLFQKEVPPFIYIIFTGFGTIIFFAVTLVLVQKNISTPVESLKNWAKDLNKEQLTQPIPNFHYSELNTLAKMILQSLSSVQESLEREQRFLGYASHELRTPIAVTRTNAELLRKMIAKGITTEKQLAVLDRIERAGFTMTDLTETLLWLNRKEGKTLPSKPIFIGELTKQVESELHYLLQGKSVKVTVSVDNTQLELPEGLCRIIITNLIRNAFQHTHNGNVSISQTGHTFSIVNRNFNDENGPDNLGFGLGLELTKRLIAHYGCKSQTQDNQDGWKVEVSFD